MTVWFLSECGVSKGGTGDVNKIIGLTSVDDMLYGAVNFRDSL